MTKEEAIKRIREWNLDTDDMEVLSAAIPELTESEDERIREEIKEFIFKRADRGDLVAKRKKWIAYLEKQKEQKEIPLMNGDADLYFDNWIQDNDTTKRGCFEEGIRYAQRLQKEQKPAEWSKNDTVFLNEIIDFFENKTSRLQHDLDMYAHWLKSLPERFNLQPKQEWSEEDEKTINDAYCWLCEYAGCSLLQKNHGKSSMLYEIADKLKSLHPQIIDSTPLYTIEQVDEKIQEAQEWSEEEKKIIRYIRHLIFEHAFANGGVDANGDYCKDIYQEADDFLKSLTFNLKKKNKDAAKLCSNEWSDEDERIRQGLIEMYKNEHLVSVPIGIHSKDIIRFLENLRPSWKPSKEQESVAERFARIVRGNLIGIDKEVQQKFEHLYFEVTGTKMYGGYND